MIWFDWDILEIHIKDVTQEEIDYPKLFRAILESIFSKTNFLKYRVKDGECLNYSRFADDIVIFGERFY